MTGINRLFALIIFTISGVVAQSQIDARYSQYYIIPAYYNPAATGNSDAVNIHGCGLWEMVGLDGAPRNFLFSADTPFRIGKEMRGGAGINFSSLSFGGFSSYKFNVQGSLKFKLGNGYLSVGVQPAFLRQRIKSIDQNPEENGIMPHAIDGNRYKKYTGDKFDAAVGAWFSVGALCLGLSVSHLFSKPSTLEVTTVNDVSETISMATGRTVNIMAAYDIALENDTWEVVPSAIYYNIGSMNHANVTLCGIWKKMLTVGVGYGWNESVSMILAAEYSGVYLGYNYDWPVHGMGRIYKGNHGIVAGYRLKLDLRERNNFRQKSIRLM